MILECVRYLEARLRECNHDVANLSTQALPSRRCLVVPVHVSALALAHRLIGLILVPVADTVTVTIRGICSAADLGYTEREAGTLQ